MYVYHYFFEMHLIRKEEDDNVIYHFKKYNYGTLKK